MTFAAKHFDPIIGIDFHIILVPPAATPTPMPNPFVGIVLDPMDYIPKIGATVRINRLPRAQAGTGGMPLIPHLPLGGPFGPPPPAHDAEIFMGSSTVAIDGEAQSYLGLPALSCQSIGIPSPPRLKLKKPKKSFVLPTSVVLAIPMGSPVIVGGFPTISLTAIAKRALLASLKPLGRGIRKLQRGKGRIGKAMEAVTRRANKAADKLAEKLKLGDKGRNLITRGICTVTGHPVDVATGKVFTDKVDLELPGPIPFRWERVWYSTSTYEGPFGHGWHCSYDAGLYIADDVVLYRAPDGRSIAFPPLEKGGEHFDVAEGLTLIRGPLGYAVRTRERLLYRFRDIGRKDGERVLSSIGDEAGHTIQLHYDDRTRLVRLIDSAGRTLEFEHDAEGRITALIAPDPDREGERFTAIQYTYDRGNLVRVVDALHAPFRYRYRGSLLVQETDRNGLSFHFEYDGKDETARCVHTWGDGGIYDHKLTYDDVHGITTVEDSLGYKTQHQHRGGLVVRTVDAVGAVAEFEYDDHGRKLKQTDPLGRSTSFEYDERGNLIRTVAPHGAKTTFEYDGQDRRTCMRDALGSCWQFRYDDQGHLVERVNPLGESTRFEYAGGLLLAMIDRAGHAAAIDYDAHRNVVAFHAPDGTARGFRYDGLGRGIEAVDEAGNVQRRTYDRLGRMTRVDEPDGNTRHLAYDGEGNVVHAQDDQHDVRMEYCGLGRIAARSEAGTTIRFEYDTEERLTGIVNAHGHVYRYELDPRGDVMKEHGFDGIRRSYQRDRAGQLIAVTRPNGDTSRYRYDRAGRVTEIEHADGTKESYAYRADGQLLSAQNATTTVNFQRDLLGRVLREVQGGHWVQSEYDARGARVRMRSSLGANQRIERDAMGRAARVDHEARDTADPFEVRFGRDVFGLELERSLPGGIRSRWERDTLGRPVEHGIEVGGRTLRARSYSWGANDRLHSIIDAQQGATRFGHDALGNLAWARYADGSAELRMPDAIGNLFRREDRRDRTYSPAGQLLESVDEQGRRTAYTYDAEGNLIEKRRSTGERWAYRWAADGMLREVERPDGSIVRFGYDALGRRVWKSYRGQTTRFVWDGNVPLHEWVEGALDPVDETAAPPEWADAAIKAREAALQVHVTRGPPERGGANAPITWLFEPESFEPMAKLVGGTRRAIVTDHLGTPNLMLDERGEATWSAEIGVWGELRNVEGDRFACPFRWPGQYEDAETGLYYNRFRYYDPEAGEYVSQDPIGFGGGDNFTAYVDDPLTTFDPLGLADCKTRVFWSGGYDSARVMQAAARWARANGGHTLEMTGKGSFTARHTANLDWEHEAMPIWRKLSKNWAKHSGDEVHVFLNSNGINPNSVWLTLEKPILEARGVTIITHLV